MHSPQLRWPVLLALMLSVVLAAIPSEPGEDEVATAQDDPGVRTTIEAYERAWNTHLASAVAVFFTEDADMVFGNGPLVRGRQAIQDWWGAYFARLDEGRDGTFAIESVRMIAPGVALVNIDSRTGGRSSSGHELPTRLARGTWVVVRQAEGWLISALRGLPAQGDTRTEPGVDH